MSAKLALVRTDARRSSRRKNASLECLPPIAPPRASLWDHEPRTFVFSRLVSIRDYTVQGYGRIDGARLDEHRDEFRRTHGRFISPRVSSLSRGRSAPAPSFTARATSSGARCPPRASHPRRRSRRSVSVSPPRTPSRRSDRRLLGRPNRRPPWSLPPPTVTPASPPSPAPALPPASPPSTVAVAFSARDDLDYVPLYGLDDRDDVARDRLYASAVRDATDALEAALLDDNLGPDDVRRDAALRLVLGDLREEIDRLLPPRTSPSDPSAMHASSAVNRCSSPETRATRPPPCSVDPSPIPRR